MNDDLLRARVAALDLDQKVRLLPGADFWALHPEPAVGLRRLVVSDGPAGVRGERWDERDTSANVPSPTALAATWDEARIGTAYVRGLQAEGVGATVKHFVANDSETERFTLDARVDERPLRELYLAPFEAIVRDGAPWAVMAAYNGVNGTTMTESPLLSDVLKDEWGFDGVVMSDWYATRTTEPAGNAALDLVMPGPGGPWREALADGRVLSCEHRHTGALMWMGTVADGIPLDAVATIEVRGRLRAGGGGEYVIGCSGLGRFALQVDGALAFDADLELPPGADPVEGLLRPPQCAAPIELAAGHEAELVLRHELGARASDSSFAIASIAFRLNVDPPHASDEEELERAISLAAEADVAVVVVGTTEEVESEGFDRVSLALPGRQDELVRRVLAANPRTVAVVNAGSPVLAPWAEEVPAVLLTGSPARSSARWPTCCSAPSSPEGGCRPPGRRRPTGCPRRAPSTVCSPARRASSSATARTTPTTACRAGPSATGWATRAGSTSR